MTYFKDRSIISHLQFLNHKALKNSNFFHKFHLKIYLVAKSDLAHVGSRIVFIYPLGVNVHVFCGRNITTLDDGIAPVTSI